MSTIITSRDENGTPLQIHRDDGFCMTTRPYNASEDGWVEDQLDPAEFPGIQIGRDTEYLVAMVNKLKRENFHLKGEVELWKKASGMFGA